MSTTTTHTPGWAKGMRKLGPGVYVDDKNAVHVSEGEICEYYGVPFTKENSAVIEETVRAALRQIYGKDLPTKIVEPSR